MVQTKLSMFIREDTPVYRKKDAYISHKYIKDHIGRRYPDFCPYIGRHWWAIARLIRSKIETKR